MKSKTELRLVGVNAAGVSSKFKSLDNMLTALSPGVFFIEETKMRKPGQIKTKMSENYIIYELIRKNGGGGGLAIGIEKNLKPVWIDEGNDDVEVLIIEARADDFKFRCVGAYGPQESEKVEKKTKFWARLSNEVENAATSEAGFILQMDGNLRAGSELIPGDPHPMNNNGKLFKDFLSQNSHLTVVNALGLCSGLITRRRQTKHRLEEAVLDVFVVCDKVLQYVTKMVVDEEKQFVLTNYNKVKGEIVAKDSDHNTLVLYMDISYSTFKPKRVEVFHLKHSEGQEQFKTLTSISDKLSGCFVKNDPFEIQASKWMKNLNNCIHQSFPKIRITTKPRKTPEHDLMDKRFKLKQQLKLTEDEDTRESLEKEIEDVEKQLAELVSEENFENIKADFAIISNSKGSFSAAGLWKAKQKKFPKHTKPLPVAKVDINGRIISNPEELKRLYLNTYIHRLRHRPIRPDLKHLESLKMELFNKRLQLVRMKEPKPWEIENLRTVLKSLKKNKSRDPHNLINELFRPENIGSDLEESLLLLLNEVKQNCKFPLFMQFADIVSIYKGRGRKNSLESDRGIFIMNIFRSILMKLIYNEEYETIDSHMSDSNIGARKRKNVRNHIFILNGVINEAMNNKKAIDVVILDYKQCFDGMWLQDSLNDLYEAGVQNHNLALMYEANSKNLVAVKTPNDITERVLIEDIIMQGEVMAPLECSVSVDTFGKECQDEEKYLFYYRDKVGVPSLSMVDDLVNISDCGLESVKLNAFINAKSNTKKFQFGKEKCHKLHFGCKHEDCPDLFIDTWKIEVTEEYDTGRKDLKDKVDEEYKIESSEEERYLGDLITSDGKNTKNVQARKSKGVGIVDKIFNHLNNVFFGPFYFQAALLLRTSLLLSSVLVNSESWYNLSSTDIQQLESADNILHRRLLETPKTTPISIMHLELGTLPIRHVIKCRRLVFLQYLLKQDKDTLMYKFFEAQLRDPQRGDWVLQVKQDLIDVKLQDITFDQIATMTEYSFQLKVKRAIDRFAFDWLISEKNKPGSKGSKLVYENLKLQNYFLPNDMTIKQCNLLFSMRSRMVQVRTNYSHSYTDLTCPVCLDTSEQDTQLNILHFTLGQNRGSCGHFYLKVQNSCFLH